jgi:hypothetical protein
MVTRASAEEARDPAVRALLHAIADDEERHAELAFRAIAWALREGGAEVARALERTVARLDAGGALAAGDAFEAPRHGRLGARAHRALSARALAEVVRPCVDALLLDTSARP